MLGDEHRHIILLLNSYIIYKSLNLNELSIPPSPPFNLLESFYSLG